MLWFLAETESFTNMFCGVVFNMDVNLFVMLLRRRHLLQMSD